MRFITMEKLEYNLVYKELQYINDVRLLLCDRDYLITENMLYIANYNEDIKLSNFKRFII